MLAVDAQIPVHAVLETVLSEQHAQLHPRSNYSQQGAGQQGGGAEAAAPQAPAMLRREGMASVPAEESAVALSCGVVSPSLPSNVLAEVCEFDSSGAGNAPAPPVMEDLGDDKQPVLRRGWTSPDDGWGTHLPLPMQDLEKMPMGMPVTVGELAEFLSHACEDHPTEGSSGSDMLEWSLAQWRAHRAKLSSQKDSERVKADATEPPSRLCVEERPLSAGPVLVHQVPLAPPRPILCVDDPQASVLKAVELLLSYPELDALPIVSPARCTVVAHLTLSYCLAYMLGRLRGSELEPLASLVVTATDGWEGGQPPAPRKFDSGSNVEGNEQSCWAERRIRVPQPAWVLGRSQPLRDLLTFFARTHHSGVPVVEDANSTVVLGLLTRRDLLHFLDLAMQSARRRLAGHGPSEGPESVVFDLSAPLEGVLDALRRFRSLPPEEAAAGGAPPGIARPAGGEKANSSVGAGLLFEKELTLKSLLLRVLGAENRKMLFVQDDGNAGGPPKLLRIVAVSDVWQLLLGFEKDQIDSIPEEPLSALDV